MNYSKILKNDIANGTGIRATLFVSGCNNNCFNCFNKEAQNFLHGNPYTKETEQKILDLLNSKYISGLSLLGGDPLCQTEADINLLITLVKKVKALNKSIWIWSGYTWEEIQVKPKAKELVELCDILVDGRYVDSLKDFRLKFRGSSNQRIINIQKSLKSNKIILEE